MSEEQADKLLQELTRLNDILLALTQIELLKLSKQRDSVEGVQKLPKSRKPTS